MLPVAKAAFDAHWLAMREPVDHRSRAGELLAPLGSAWQELGWSRVLDLGSGTGSNLRYLAPRLPGAQMWTLLDEDESLLARVDEVQPNQSLTRLCGDLAHDGLEAVGRAHLVTGAALLDLVSDGWLRRLTEACCDASCGALFALTYDGTIQWSRGGGTESLEDSEDALVRTAVNAHQHRDKGLGAALGPTAGPTADALFREAGYHTWLLPSPWRLAPPDRALTIALLDGWQQAASEERPELADSIRAWRERRRFTLDSDGWSVVVGHLDLLALPEPS